MHSIVLPPHQWGLVERTFVEEFDNKMPTNPDRATFITLMNSKDWAGFVHVETLYHFNVVYVKPEYGSDRQKLAMKLIHDAAQCIPAGYSGIWLTDRKVDRIASLVGARHVGDYRVYRKDR